MASVHFLCAECEWRITAEAGVGTVNCEGCGRAHEVGATRAGEPVDLCAACGSDALYVQKDFNRTTGLIMVGIGAVFVPWTWGLSLLAVTLIDVGLWFYLGDVTVCYSCRAVHRGFPINRAHGPFDLATHDRHVYGSAPPGAE